MKAVRRFAFMIVLLIVGTLIGHLSIQATIVIFSGLFVFWYMTWDDKKYAQTKREINSRNEEYYYPDEHYHGSSY